MISPCDAMSDISPVGGCQVDCMNLREIYVYKVKTTLMGERRLHKWDERTRHQRTTSYTQASDRRREGVESSLASSSSSHSSSSLSSSLGTFQQFNGGT